MNDKEITEKYNQWDDNQMLTNKEISLRLDRINSLYINLPKRKEEDSHSSTISPPSSSFKVISPITKAESLPLTKASISHPEASSVSPSEEAQLLGRKRKLKKINRSKREIAIHTVNCPTEYNIAYNYSYLLNDFWGELDDYSRFNSQVKSEMDKNRVDVDRGMNFGESPCKLYCDFFSEGKDVKASAIDNAVRFLPMFACESKLAFQGYCLPEARRAGVKEKKAGKKKEEKRNEEVKSKEEVNEDEPEDNRSIKPLMSKQNSQNERKYRCTLCTFVFASPQGLGGHMSRSHKDQSIKFQNKKQIRQSREPQRKLLEKAKALLCEKFYQDYFLLLKTKRGKEVIKSLVLTYKKEYKAIRKRLKKEPISVLIHP